MKKCKLCGKEKELSEYYEYDLKTHRYRCKECRRNAVAEWRKKNKKRMAQYHKEYRKDNREKLNRQCRKWCRDATEESLIAFEQDCKNQNGICPICHRKKKLVYDHNHITLLYRGAICNDCNRMIGMAYDDPTILQSAIDYLNNPKVKSQVC